MRPSTGWARRAPGAPGRRRSRCEAASISTTSSEGASRDRHADAAGVVGVERRPSLAVHRLGEDARERGLARAARPGEEVDLPHLAALERVRGVRDRLLPDDVPEGLWTVLAVERGHESIQPDRSSAAAYVPDPLGRPRRRAAGHGGPRPDAAAGERQAELPARSAGVASATWQPPIPSIRSRTSPTSVERRRHVAGECLLDVRRPLVRRGEAGSSRSRSARAAPARAAPRRARAARCRARRHAPARPPPARARSASRSVRRALVKSTCFGSAAQPSSARLAAVSAGWKVSGRRRSG